MLMPSISDKRPPFVRFEEREMGLNQKASEEAGRPVPCVVIMACITPHGSKDVVEKIAEEWFKQNKDKALRGEYPIEWCNFFEAQFAEWKKGHELPREGTPVKTWPMVTGEARNRLIALGITTVEDLAQFPDTALGNVGMDGRYLRDTARAWINEAKDKGINTKAIADANVRITELERQNEELARQVRSLNARLAADEDENPRRRKRGEQIDAIP